MQDRIDHVISRYLSGEIENHETQELLEWLKASEEHRKIFFNTKILWSAAHAKEEEEEEKLTAASMKIVQEKIKKLEKTRKYNLFRKNLFKTAAVAAALLGIIFSLTIFKQKSAPPVLLTYSNTMTDSIMRIVLEDQSTVWLNGNTTLKVLTFNDKQRSVELDGCAFFEVSSNPERPFTVQKGDYRVRVLGTSFGVNTRYEGGQYETVLLEGSVRIERGTKEESTTLLPGQQAIYSKEQSLLNINNIDAKKYTLWRFGIISLTDVSISEILSNIEEIYHVKLDMDISGLENNRYNFFFMNKKNVEETLKYLHYLTDREPEILHFY